MLNPIYNLLYLGFFYGKIQLYKFHMPKRKIIFRFLLKLDKIIEV